MRFRSHHRQALALNLLVATGLAGAGNAAIFQPSSRASAASATSATSAALTKPAAPAASAEATAKPLNLNKATEAQFARLPGLSAADVAAIISNRPKTGYKNKEELLERRILLPKTYEKVKDMVIVP